MIKHFEVTVSELDEKFEGGDIYDFASLAAVNFMEKHGLSEWHVVNIESVFDVRSKRAYPLSEFSTWYDCEYVTLHVWLAKD